MEDLKKLKATILYDIVILLHVLIVLVMIIKIGSQPTISRYMEREM